MFDSIVFLDFTFSKVELEAVELNLTELYSHWADICAVARRITGKTFILDGSESVTHRGKIFPSFRSDSSLVELIMGQGCAVRSWVLRAPTHSDISYRISSFIEHDLAQKRHH